MRPHVRISIDVNLCTDAHKQCTSTTRAPTTTTHHHFPSNQLADLVRRRLQAACELFFAQEERPGPGGTP